MAKTNGGSDKQVKAVAPNFKDVPKSTVDAARAALSGGRQDPLKVPANAKVSTNDSGTSYSRWAERAVIQQAYRTTSKSKLMDVVVISKIRQSGANSGKKVWSHFYMNQGEEISEGHEIMNELSIGAISTLLVATGFMPAGGALKGSLLDKMFPRKNEPGTSSPLVSKPVIVNVVQEHGQAKDFKTGKLMEDDEGNKIMNTRDSGESYLPEKVEKEDAEEGEEEEE